jgi:hypothetical protein
MWTETVENGVFNDGDSHEIDTLSPHTKWHPPLKVGDYVWMQNQMGNSPRKWDHSGQVIEVRQHDRMQ